MTNKVLRRCWSSPQSPPSLRLMTNDKQHESNTMLLNNTSIGEDCCDDPAVDII